MSGPIIRKYGFPNFEKIFGERDIQHGAGPAKADPAAPDVAEDGSKLIPVVPKPADPRVPDAKP